MTRTIRLQLPFSMAIAKRERTPIRSPIPLGSNSRGLEIDGISWREVVHKPNQKYQKHYHNNPTLAFIVKGSSSEVLSKGSIHCTAQSLIIMPAGEVHANHYDQAGCLSLVIEIKPPRLESISSYSKVLDQFSLTSRPAFSILLTRIYKEILVMDTASPLAMEGLTLELLSDLARSSSRVAKRGRPRWLRQAYDYVHAHFTEAIGLDDIAKSIGVHPVHLARMFRESYGLTLGEQVRALRIEFACTLLSTSDTRLAEIAFAAGFSDQAHFSKVFKQYIGITPSQYRLIHSPS
jgi:AraC family transcriptional regulator